MNQVPFAYDIVLISSNLQELNNMLGEVNQASKKINLKMKFSNSNTNSNFREHVYVENRKFEHILGSRSKRKNQANDLHPRNICYEKNYPELLILYTVLSYF